MRYGAGLDIPITMCITALRCSSFVCSLLSYQLWEPRLSVLGPRPSVPLSCPILSPRGSWPQAPGLTGAGSCPGREACCRRQRGRGGWPSPAAWTRLQPGAGPAAAGG